MTLEIIMCNIKQIFRVALHYLKFNKIPNFLKLYFNFYRKFTFLTNSLNESFAKEKLKYSSKFHF